MTKQDLLKLNLQHFADDGEGDGEGEEVTPDEKKQTESEPDGDGTNKQEERTFTQAELDEILSKRLAREKKKAEEEAEEKRLKEQNEFKSLYEKSQEKIKEYERKEAERVRLETIVSKLKEHGFSDEQAQKHSSRINKLADDDESLEDEIKDYVSDFKSANTIEPSAGFGKKGEHKYEEDEEYGKNTLERVRGLSKTQYN